VGGKDAKPGACDGGPVDMGKKLRWKGRKMLREELLKRYSPRVGSSRWGDEGRKGSLTIVETAR